jgi:hypothetical protein
MLSARCETKLGGNVERLVRTLILCSLLAGSASAQAVPSADHNAATPSAVPALPEGSWRFIVSGDSRNCGDVVMPAIAAHSAQFAPSFYWHLGDLRAIYKIDEDIAFSNANDGRALSCETYHKIAWSDFVAHQIGAFGDVPFYLGIGNHELILPKSENAFKREFADWLDQPTLRRQRQLDQEPAQPEAYYHWIQGGVDFIYLNNASDCFSNEQMHWLMRRLRAAKSDPAIKSVVVGMHEALPGSFASDHSMGDKKDEPLSLSSGLEAYAALAEFRKHKPVYVLSSHSHFFMENIFSTPQLTANGTEPLSGWIVGTAGAVRYRLPDPRPAAPATSQTDTYGYLLGTVSAEGTIRFSYQEIRPPDVPQYVWGRYPAKAVLWCFQHNSQNQNKEPKAPDLTPLCNTPRVPTCGRSQ